MNNKLFDIFCECFNNLETWEKIAIHNDFASKTGTEEEIFNNDEETLNILFNSAYDVLQSITDDYHVNDEYCWNDELGNLNSGDTEDELPLAELDELFAHYCDFPSYLKEIKGMSEFYDAWAYGIEEDEKEDEDEDF